LLNLAINARDAMPEGGRLMIGVKDIHLSGRDLIDQLAVAYNGAQPGDYIEISVTDTGAGMTADVRARAFEPFFTTKPLGEGTGLGLSQIYGFMRQSHGLMRLESAPGRGTTISLYLPRYSANSTDIRQPEAPPAAPPAVTTTGTVLVVDDEASIRALLDQVLRELGCHVLEAEDGLAGLRMLQSPKQIDLLVTDIGLPGLNARHPRPAHHRLCRHRTGRGNAGFGHGSHRQAIRTRHASLKSQRHSEPRHADSLIVFHARLKPLSSSEQRLMVPKPKQQVIASTAMERAFLFCVKTLRLRRFWM
jgi:hypothetical protein